MGLLELHRPIGLQRGLVGDEVVHPLAVLAEAISVPHGRERGIMSASAVRQQLGTLPSNSSRMAHSSASKTMRGLSEYFTLRLSSRSLALSSELRTTVGVRKSLK